MVYDDKGNRVVVFGGAPCVDELCLGQHQHEHAEMQRRRICLRLVRGDVPGLCLIAVRGSPGIAVHALRRARGVSQGW